MRLVNQLLILQPYQTTIHGGGKKRAFWLDIQANDIIEVECETKRSFSLKLTNKRTKQELNDYMSNIHYRLDRMDFKELQ
jgi:hypothetical protein